MSSNQIWHEIRIRAAPRTVFEALTDARKLAQWWIPDVRGESKPGSLLEFRIGEFSQPMLVAALEPDRLVRWVPTDKGLPDWRGTQIEFTLLQKESRTYLHLRHSAWRNDVAEFPYYSMSWAAFLASLKELLQEGRGHPFPNPWVND